MLAPRLLRSATLALLVLAGSLPAVAHAGVTVEGTGEPAFTNSANNTQWVRWAGPSAPYRLSVDYYTNAVSTKNDGPHPMPSTGTSWINWSGIASTPLTEGSTYAICANGQWFDGGMWFPDGSGSCFDGSQRGLRTSTTIDRTGPTVGLQLAGGAAFSKSAALPVQMDFTDNLAGPFPANFLCVQYGSAGGGLCDSSQGYQYVIQPSCSQPGTGGRSTRFDCTLDVGAGDTPAPDGPVSICAIATDAAIPDNPNMSDQRGNATSANRSAPSCDTVLLDRTAPDLTVASSPATGVKAGDSVAFDAVGADALTGVKNSYSWNWGDGTKGSGRAMSHTFAAAGTYTVTLKAGDTAGNQTTATKRITVGPAGTPVPPVDAPPANTITVSAPAQVAVPATGIGKINVTFTPSSAGRVTFTLVRGTTTVAVAGTTTVAGKRGYALKLPAGTAPGVHTLKVAYTPTGRAVINKSVTTTLTGGTPGLAPNTRLKPATPDVSGAGTQSVLPDGRYRGPQGTTAAAAPTR